MTLAQTAKIVVPSDMLNWDHGLFDQEGPGAIRRSLAFVSFPPTTRSLRSAFISLGPPYWLRRNLRSRKDLRAGSQSIVI